MHDGHIHSHWSWDTEAGVTLEAILDAARTAGLTSVTVADHLDIESDGWCRSRGRIRTVRRGGSVRLDRRSEEASTALRFTQTRLTESPPNTRGSSRVELLLGIEVGEPHLFSAAMEDRLQRADVVLASVHSVVVGGDLIYVDEALSSGDAHRILNLYFDEVERMIDEAPKFDVLTHINFPFRFLVYEDWWRPLESRYRRVFRAAAARDSVVEINARAPALTNLQHQWAAEEGISQFVVGSDAHSLAAIGSGVESAGDFLTRNGYSAHDGKIFART